MKQLAIVMVMLAMGCVAEEESTVTGASGVDPIYLRIEGVNGEATDKSHNQWVSVAFLDDTATVTYGTDCTDFSCVLAIAVAHRQSTSVWRFDVPEPGVNHIVVHGDTAVGPSVEIGLAGAGVAQGLVDSLVVCHARHDCPPIKGRFCLPECEPL